MACPHFFVFLDVNRLHKISPTLPHLAIGVREFLSAVVVGISEKFGSGDTKLQVNALILAIRLNLDGF